MTKFTSEIKLKIIQGFNSKIFSQKEYAKQMGVIRALLRQVFFIVDY